MKQLEILTDSEIEKIHDCSLHILEKTGVHFWGAEKGAADILQKHGCRVNGEKVYIPRQLVEKSLKSLPKREGLSYFNHIWYRKRISLERGCTNLSLVGNAYYTADYGAKKARVATNEDFENKDCVFDALDSFDLNYCIIFPLPGHESTTKPFFDNLSDAQAAIDFLSSRVARRGLQGKSKWMPHLIFRPEGYKRLELLSYAILEGSNAMEDMLMDSEQTHLWVNPLSPLQYHTEATIGAVDSINIPKRPIIISPECMMGMTSPVTLAGTVLQQNAEVLGMVVLAQLANPGVPCVYGSVSTVTDLRNSETSHGSYESQLLHVAAVQMADYYNMPSRIAPGNTSALLPGARSAAETALGLYMGMAAGANIITIGLLNSTLTLSLEHMVYVDELFKQYKMNCRGFEVNDETLAMNVIHDEGHPSPNFLLHEHTIENMRRDVYYSPWTGRIDTSYEDIYAHGNKKVKEILQTEFKPNADAVERCKLVCERLKEDMSHIQTGSSEWWRFYCKDI